MDPESIGNQTEPNDGETEQNHRVHIVRVVYQNVIPKQCGKSEREKSTQWSSLEENCNDCRLSTEISNDSWSCTTCTVTPCRCSVTNLTAASKCSSCDSFIEAQQPPQEPGPVQLEYSCRCHSNDVTVVKTVCAKCATKIHDLLADILVCERRDDCVRRQLAVTTNPPDSSADVCSNCQVVGSRILNTTRLGTTTDVKTSSDIPPPLPERKFITRGAVRTPPPPKKRQVRLPPKTIQRHSPPTRRRLQRTRSADSPSDSDSSLSDSSDYHINLQYKPGVVPNEYIESDDFPTSTHDNVPFDLSSLTLNDSLNQQYSDRLKPKSPCHRATSNTSPVISSSLSSMCASPASVSHSSPETVYSENDSKSHKCHYDSMHGSTTPNSVDSSSSRDNSKNTSPLNVLDPVSCSQPSECSVASLRRDYTVVEYHGVDTQPCRSGAIGDLIDLRSPVTCSPPLGSERDILNDFPILLPEIDTPDFVSEYSDSVLEEVKGAEGGACTPANFDLDFIVACDEAGVPDLGPDEMPDVVDRRKSCDNDMLELNDEVFEEASSRCDNSCTRDRYETRCDSVNDLDVACSSKDAYARTHRRTGSAGGRVETVESPPPKLPLKPSLSLNQSPPPIPKRDFKPRERHIMSRPHRVSRPQAFDRSAVTRENPTVTPDAELPDLPMPDIETNRTVTQLVFGAEQAAAECSFDKRPQSDIITLTPLSQDPHFSQPAAQRKKRPLSCLLKPKHTLNKIFHKKSSKDLSAVKEAKGPVPAQRELPPIPVDSRNYCLTEPAHLEMMLPPESPPGLLSDLPPPLLPREPVQGMDQHWAAERQAAQRHKFIDSLIKLREVGWYWGPLSMDKAEAKLADKKDGSFLVRDSSHDSYILSLSFRSQNRTHHTRIEFFHGTFGFWSQPSSHGRMSIVEFIEKAMEHSRNGKFLYFLRPHSPGQAPSPVVLLYPISRYERIQSLQHSCRFVILKYVRYDHIDQLPLPTAIRTYLKDKHYFSEQTAESSSE